MSADPVTPARRRRAARATSEELVEAAIRVIARDGIAAATTRRIADEAGVPLGTVHYWFDDKNDLLEDVVKEVVGRLEKAIDEASPADGAAPPDLRAALEGAWRVVVEDDPGAQLGLYELTTLALRTPAMRDLARRQYESYRATAARGLAPVLGELDAERAAALAELVAVTFDGLCLAWLADPEGARPDAVLDLLAELVGGLGRADA